jgi:hypothetical protein
VCMVVSKLQHREAHAVLQGWVTTRQLALLLPHVLQ